MLRQALTVAGKVRRAINIEVHSEIIARGEGGVLGKQLMEQKFGESLLLCSLFVPRRPLGAIILYGSLGIIAFKGIERLKMDPRSNYSRQELGNNCFARL